MRYRRRGSAALACALAVLVFLTWAGPAAGAPGEISLVRIAGRPPGAELRVRGQLVIRLFGADAGRRLQSAAGRLDPLLGPSVAITSATTRTSARLIVNDQVVLAAGRTDAAIARTTPALLVRQWADALDAALAVPPITLSQTEVILSPGRPAVVTVSTMLSGPIVAGGFDQRVADVRLAGGEVRIVGKNPGNTIVPLRVGPYRAQVAVSVRRPAGVIPAETDVVVTGLPANPDLIREAVERRLQEAVRREPGGSMDLGEIVVNGPLAPGASTTVPVAVAIRSPYAGPVDGTVHVRVKNEPVQLADPDVLLISNRPETITGNGLLFKRPWRRGGRRGCSTIT